MTEHSPTAPAVLAAPAAMAEVDPQAAQDLIGSGAVLLDVREPDEWEAGHSPDATHMPLGSLDPDALPSGRVVVAVCRSGARSAKATAALTAAGIQARNLTGGMKAWAAAGLPVHTPAGQPGTIA